MGSHGTGMEIVLLGLLSTLLLSGTDRLRNMLQRFRVGLPPEGLKQQVTNELRT